MKIQGVFIDGFKNLLNVNIKFDNITALVALNNFGKSNVLTGIDFGIAFIKASPNDKKRMMENSDLIPINIRMYGDNYKFQMDILTDINDIEYRITYGYEFSWKCSKASSPTILTESLKIKENNKGQKYTQLINRGNGKSLYKSSEKGRCSVKIHVGESELIINKLLAFDGLFYMEVIERLNNMTFYMENSLDPRAYYQPNPFVKKESDNMTVDVENLPRIIYQLSKNNRDQFDLLKNVFKELFPEVDDIIVQQYDLNVDMKEELPEDAPYTISNAIYILYVKDKNLKYPIKFSSMSDGAQRVFLILTKIILANIANVSLIAIEEPENSVHPSLFQDYLYIINQLLDDCKIIITSHSPYVVSYLNPAWIRVGVNEYDGIATFLPFKKTGQNLLQQEASTFHMSTGDYLFSLLSDEDINWDKYLEGGNL